MTRKEAALMYSNMKIERPITATVMTKYQKKKKKLGLAKQLRETQKKEAQLEDLTRQGDLERATRLKMQDLWQIALDKSEGKKVKDDVKLIKKTIKKVHKRKEKSRKEWQERTDQVQQRKDKKQNKRLMNIKKRKQAKIQKKIKKRNK